MTKSQRAAYMRDYRRRKKIEAERELYLEQLPQSTKILAFKLAKWSRENLIVPHGHNDAGKPMELPDFGIDFIADAMNTRESLLCVARKNAKSAIIAVYILARLVGVLRVRGYRAGVCSVSKEKASELYDQIKDIASASKLEGLTFRYSPKQITSSTGKVDILSADKTAGHASGFDDAILDELGLLPERKRDLINGLRSSVSARNGRFIALSIMGDSPFTREMLERKHMDTTCVHYYAANETCAIDDEDAWRSANPGLGTVKSLEYMKDEAARCLFSPSDEKAFRAFDLNQPHSPTRETICTVSEYRACLTDELPPRGKRCVIGFDAGGANSMTAAVVFYIDTKLVETYAAFAGIPDLIARGNEDQVGDLYLRMSHTGSLKVFDGQRVTPIADFLEMLFDDIGSANIIAFGCDRYRKNEVVQAFEKIGRIPSIVWRGTGAHAFADGSYDVRAFQRIIKQRQFKMKEELTWINAITESEIRYDGAGNPALDKRRHRSRIDVLQSAVIAAGLVQMTESVGEDNLTLTLC